jgi:hypothetical protein
MATAPSGSGSARWSRGRCQGARGRERMEQGNLSNVEWFRGIGEYKID